jgi:hypothetical protein
MTAVRQLVRFFKQRVQQNASGKLAPAHAAPGGDAPASTLFLRSSFAPEAKSQDFKIRMARRTSVLEDALGLLNRRYRQRGYGFQTLSLSKQRMTIVAYEGRRVMGTLTVQLDTGAGLLGDECFKPELDGLRSQGASLCEFIKLATASDAPMPATLASMFHVAFIFAHQIHSATHAAIEVNPRHAAFYKRVLGFSQHGTPTGNPRVNAPGVLLVGDFRRIGEQLRARDQPAADGNGPPAFFAHSFANQEAEGIRRRIEAALRASPAVGGTRRG